MSVVSIRFNQSEEKILKKLENHFEQDKSSLIKHSLMELYQDLIDLHEISKFEDKEKKGKTKFISDKDFLKML